MNDTIRPPGAPQVLVVDDEPQILMIMRFALETAGFTVVTATDGAQAWSTFKQRRFDLVVLDLMIPVVSGVAVAERIRGISDVPIMMITALSDEPDRIRGLEAGADDYVTKPFSPRELTLRAQALVRRWHGRHSPALSNGDLVIDTASHRVPTWFGAGHVRYGGEVLGGPRPQHRERGDIRRPAQPGLGHRGP